MVFPIDNRVFETQTADVLAAGAPGQVYIGQAAWRLMTGQCVKQLDIARQAGAPGYVLFSYTYASQKKPGDKVTLMDALAKAE